MSDLIGRRLVDLPTPAFCIDKVKLSKNCQKISDICQQAGVTLRAQTKTHKTIEGALMQTDGHADRRLVVSTLAEAEFYAQQPQFQDILYGYPLTADKLKRCAILNKQIKQLSVLINDNSIIDRLISTGDHWTAFIAVDCGYHREGMEWDSDEVVATAVRLYEEKSINFEGIYTHCGHSYDATVPSAAAADACRKMTNLKDRLVSVGIECRVYGIGSTPSCSAFVTEMKSINEIHPGNYVFYDLEQEVLGSCGPDEIACTIATRVIAHYPQRNELLIDCGFTARTKEGMHIERVFAHHPELRLVSMTQEIGTVTADGPIDFSSYPIGSVLFQYPYHSCASAGQHDKYLVHEDGVVVAVWRPCRGW